MKYQLQKCGREDKVVLTNSLVVPTVMCRAQFRALTKQEQNKLNLWKEVPKEIMLEY